MDDLGTAEFAGLRDTIRIRGTARIACLLAGFVAWAGVLVLVLVWLPWPLAAVIPLLVLLATHEAGRALHLGVERIGRYLQVFYEERQAGPDSPLAPPAWERTAMQLGPSLPGAGGHPLFLPVFLLATAVNALAVVLPGPILIESLALAVPHLALVAWLLHCHRGMRRQRASDLERYREMKKSRR